MRSPLWLLAVPLAAVLCALLGWWINEPQMSNLAKEGHFLESLTVGLYLLLFASLIAIGFSGRRFAWWAAPMPLLAALREMDLNKQLPLDKIDRAEFWTSSSIGLGWKVFGPIAVALLLAYFVAAFRKLLPRASQLRRQGHPAGVMIYSALILLVASFFVDKGWGAFPESFRPLGYIMEEMLETFAPLALLAGTLLWVNVCVSAEVRRSATVR